MGKTRHVTWTSCPASDALAARHTSQGFNSRPYDIFIVYTASMIQHLWKAAPKHYNAHSSRVPPGPPREHFTRQSRTLRRFARASRAISCSALDPAPEAASSVFLRATAPAPPGLAARYVPRRPPPARFAARVGIASPLHAAPSNAARGPRAALRPTRCATSRHAGSVAAACRAPHVACDAYGPDV